MRSVVMAGSSKYLRSSSQDSIKRAVSYLRFMRFKVASQPDCIERWKCGQRYLSFAARAQNSSVMVRGSSEPRRMRISPPSRAMSSKRSMSEVPSLKSEP